MALPLATGGVSFTTPTCIGAWIEYPFRNNQDQETKVYHHIMRVSLLSYVPLVDDVVMTAAGAKPSGSPFPDDAGAFYIGDTELKPLDGGVVEFVRAFANIPISKTEGAGLYGFTFPAISIPLSVVANCRSGTGDLLTANSRPEVRFSLTAANAENFNVGDKCQVTTAAIRVIFKGQSSFTEIVPFYVIYSKTASGSNFNYSGYMVNYIAVESVVAYSNLTTFTIAIPKVLARLSTMNQNSESFLTYRYVKTSDITTESLEVKFQVLVRTGNNPNYAYSEVDTVAALTYPTDKEYGGLVYQGGVIQAEPEVAHRWRGNIWEIIGRKVRAK
jgi:hypothetical protein